MIRVGMGYDLHRLEAGRPLILGGVTVPFEKGLAGHSDADVLAHAVTDALLGALALGNIGQLFPDDDPKYAGADSMGLLAQTLALVRARGYRIGNVDANIVAQRPKLNPYIEAIRAALAKTLGVNVAYVSVKAKTNEGVGPEGRGEAISAHAVVIVARDA